VACSWFSSLLGSQGVVLRQTAQNFPVRQQTLPPCIHAVWGGVYRQRTLWVQGLVLAGSPVLAKQHRCAQ